MRYVCMLAIGIMTTLALGACGPQGTPTPPPLTVAKVSVPGGTYTNVGPAQLKQMLTTKDFMLVNVHVPYAGELAQTDVFIPYTEVEGSLSQLPADKQARIVLYCSSGRMSGIAATALVKLGYTNVWNLDGGMVAWQNAGYEVLNKDR